MMSKMKEQAKKGSRLRRMYVEEKLKAEIVAEAPAKKWFGHLGAARWPNVRSRRAACRFGLCFLYLRTVNRFDMNNKRE